MSNRTLWEESSFHDGHKDHRGFAPGDVGDSHRHSGGVVITDPDACVNGRTLTQWTEQWYRWAVPSSGGDTTAFYDPTGDVAAALNDGFNRMYFITQQAGGPPSAVRTFDVPFGEPILAGIVGVADSEGPGINPTIPGFTGSDADQVKTVLASYTFTNGTYQLDGGKPVTNLPVIESGIFNAGYAPKGSAGAEFFGAENGALLKTTGEKGYWVILDHLSPGQHDFKASGTISFPGGSATVSVHDIINLVLPS
jgi:hypothetical protein